MIIFDEQPTIARVEAIANQALKIAKIAEAKAQASLVARRDYSITAWINLLGLGVPLAEVSALDKAATKLSKERGIKTGKATDCFFGLVNTYDKSILAEVFAEAGF